MKTATRAYKIGAGINTGVVAVGRFLAFIGKGVGTTVRDVAVGSVKGLPETTPQITRRIVRKARR